MALIFVIWAATYGPLMKICLEEETLLEYFSPISPSFSCHSLLPPPMQSCQTANYTTRGEQ